MRLSIIIPAHNEEARIGRMLDAYLPFYADRYGNQVELIIVVNGSTDDTSGVVEGYVARYAQLRCIVDPNRIGKGGALLRGFREARGDLIGFVDADGSTPPAAFQDLVDRLGDADVAVASRWCDGASVSPRQPLARRIASRVFNLLTRVLFGLRLTDTQCGAKLMRRDALIPILGYLGITRWAFDVDLLFQLHRSGRTIVEIPTTWQDVAGSKVDILSVSAEMLAAVARLRLVYSPLRWVVGVYDSLIGPVIHPDGLERDHLFGHSAVLLACAQLTHLGNLLFQGSMMRMLDDTQYGILAAMLGVFAAVTMPLSALPWAMAHFTARAIRDGRPREARALLSAVTRDVAIAGAVGLAIAFFSADAIARSFKLEGELPLLLTAAAVVVSLGGSTALGAIQGSQRFVWMAGSAIAWSFSRFFFAAAFVALGGAATGALLGHTASMIVSALLAVMGMRRVFGSVRERPERTPGFYRYCAQYAAASIGYAVLMNADIILVKHYFSPDEAGRYAIAAMVGRIILFLPQPIVTAMFPKVASGGEVTPANWHTLAKALVLATIMIGGAALFCSLFPEITLLMLAGERSLSLVPLVRLMAWALCPLSLTFFIMSFELAQRRFAVAVPLIVCAAAYVAGLVVWHSSLRQVIGVLAVAGSLAFVSAVACLPWSQTRMRKWSRFSSGRSMVF